MADENLIRDLLLAVGDATRLLSMSDAGHLIQWKWATSEIEQAQAVWGPWILRDTAGATTRPGGI